MAVSRWLNDRSALVITSPRSSTSIGSALSDRQCDGQSFPTGRVRGPAPKKCDECSVLQGQTVEDYLRHAIDIADWVYALRDVYAARGQAADFRVCIGSLCRRNAVVEILEIVNNVCAVLPDLALHLLGRLGPVICHFHCMGSPPHDPG